MVFPLAYTNSRSWLFVIAFCCLSYQPKCFVYVHQYAEVHKFDILTKCLTSVLMALITGLFCLGSWELHLGRWHWGRPTVCEPVQGELAVTWHWPPWDGLLPLEYDQKECAGSMHSRCLLDTTCKFMNNFHNFDSTTWWSGAYSAVLSRTECL